MRSRISALVLLSLAAAAAANVAKELTAEDAQLNKRGSNSEELARMLEELKRNHDDEEEEDKDLMETKHQGPHDGPHHGPHEGPHHQGPHHGPHELSLQERYEEDLLNRYYEKVNKDSQAGKEYESRSDIFEEVRWQEVYADDLDTRDMRVMNSLTHEQEQAILKLHNDLRRQEGASNMETLKYNPKLAELGQTWSKRCVFEHGQPPFSVSAIGYKDLGQNIYAHSNPNFKVEDAVQAWYDEKKDYQYNSASCNAGKVCGHYTAVTWAKTTEVGCGLTFCPSISGLTKAHFIVCNYAPPGNWQGEKPFLKGPACTQCDSGKFFCNNNLCDKACNSEGANCQCKAACQKGGKKTGKCTCECPAGSTGPDCGLQCADRDPKCGANPGYPQFLCTMNDPNWAFVKEKCPKLCKACSTKRSDDSSLSAFKRLLLGYLEKEANSDEK